LAVRVDQGGQPGRVHERHRGEVDRDRVPVVTQPCEHVDELRRCGDVQLAMQDERTVAAEV
jgi:hypothetical protein